MSLSPFVIAQGQKVGVNALQCVHVAKKMIIVTSLFLGMMSLSAAVNAATSEPKYATYPSVNVKSGYPVDQIKKGEYLVKAGDCIACHTNSAENGPAFSGGLPFKTPFGTFYSQNITPDKTNGIGNWSEAQFIKAVRHGVRADGSNSFPVFPYTSFNYVSDEDVKAIRAYLMSIPAVAHDNKEPDAPWPLRWRFAQWGWKLLFSRDNGPYVNDSAHTAEWNRGAYLVKGLGHCGECHTPRNPLGGMKHKYELTGAFVDGYYAPNISAVALKDQSVDNIVNVFHGQLLNGRGKVGGPMAEVNHDSLQYMTAADLRAMAVYIKTVNSEQPPVAASNGPVSSDEAKSLYKEHCAVCHDVGAAGAPKTGDATAWAPRIKTGIDTLYKTAINGINSMPAMGACPTCSQDQIKSIVDYMVAESQGAAGANAAAVPGVKALTLEDGKKIYDKQCASCHQPNATAKGALNAPKTGDKVMWKPILDKNIDILILHTLNGYRDMPKKGGCATCSTAEIKAAVKYMAQQSQNGKDYSLW